MISNDDVTTAPAEVEPAPVKTRRKKGEGKRYGQVAKRGVVWSYFREGVSELITTPTAIILARLLTPFDFGVAASAAFFLTLATRLTNFGFNQALVRIRDLRPEHASSVFVITLAAGVCAYVILTSAAGLIGQFFRAPQVAELMPVAALTFLISPFGTVPAALMTRNLELKRTAAADWIGGVTEAVSAVVMALMGYGFWSIVYGRVIGDVMNTGAKLALGRWRISFRFSSTALRELFSFGAGVFVKRLFDYFARNLDNLVVGRLLGVAALGFYDKAFVTMSKVLVRINTGGSSISFRVFSMIAEEQERFQRAYRKVVLAGSLISFPVLTGLAASGDELIIVMYGERWAPAVLPFQILCVAGAFKVMNEYAGSAAQAGGRVWDQVARQAVYTTLIAASVALFSIWGLAGAAAGVLLATVVMTVMMSRLLGRVAGITFGDLVRAQTPGLIAAGCVVGAIIGVRFAFATWLNHLPVWVWLGAELLAGAMAYMMFLKFTPFREVRVLIRDLAADLQPPLANVAKCLS